MVFYFYIHAHPAFVHPPTGSLGSNLTYKHPFSVLVSSPLCRDWQPYDTHSCWPGCQTCRPATRPGKPAGSFLLEATPNFYFYFLAVLPPMLRTSPPFAGDRSILPLRMVPFFLASLPAVLCELCTSLLSR